MKADWIACGPEYKNGTGTVRVVLRHFQNKLVVHTFVTFPGMSNSYQHGHYFRPDQMVEAWAKFNYKVLEMVANDYTVILPESA